MDNPGFRVNPVKVADDYLKELEKSLDTENKKMQNREVPYRGKVTGVSFKGKSDAPEIEITTTIRREPK